MKRTLVLLACFVLLSSHELFLKTNSHFHKAHEEGELFLFNGTFDESENIISRDRIINARVTGPDYEFLPEKEDYYDKDHVTYLRFRTGGEGTYVAGVSTLPRVIELNAKDFKEYLEHEGLHDVIKEREREGISSQPAKERYSKHVKALLQVADARTDHYKTTLGYPIEFIPQQNPYDLKQGDEFTLTLLAEGRPLANQVVHYSSRPGDTTENSQRTDKKGQVKVKLNKTGKWYVATIHMVKAAEKDIDYVSNWATLTFEVK